MAAHDRPIVTRQGDENRSTAQSGGMTLITGVGPQHTPAARLWFGKASNEPGFRSLPHHHGEAETGAYLLSGERRDDARWEFVAWGAAKFPRNSGGSQQFPSLDSTPASSLQHGR